MATNAKVEVPLTEEAQSVYAAWRIADALRAADCPLEAIQVLEGLLAMPLTAAMVREEVATRTRLAAMILDETQSPEAARRALEPCVRHFSSPAVPLAERVTVLRLLAVSARRRGQAPAAQQYLARAAALVDGSGSGSGGGGAAEGGESAAVAAAALPVLRAEVAVERARLHFTRAVASNFADSAAVDALRSSTQDYLAFAASPKTNRHARTLALSHVYGHFFAGDVGAGQEHLAQGVAVFGPAHEFTLLQHFAGVCFTGGYSCVALVEEEEEEEEKVGEDDEERRHAKKLDASAGGSTPEHQWLSSGCVKVLRQLLVLLQLAAASKHDDCVAAFNALIVDVEWHMRSATTGGGGGGGGGGGIGASSAGGRPSASSVAGSSGGGGPSAAMLEAEMRCLVGVKVVAYMQIALSDLTRLDVCAAAAKIAPLCTYVAMFHRHTAHFRTHVHVLVALLCLHLALPQDAVAHASVAASCTCDEGELVTAQLVRALALHCSSRLSPSSASSAQAALHDCLEQLLVQLPLDDGERRPGDADGARVLLTSEGSRARGSHITPTAPLLSSSSPSSSPSCRRRAASSPRGTTPQLPRQRLMLRMLVGASFLSKFDFPRAIAALKRAADEAKQFFGVGNPIVGQCLRLAGEAQMLAGNRRACDNALAAAIQLGEKTRDELSLIHCLAFSLKHLVIVNDADRQRQRQLHKSFEESQGHYISQVATANSMKQVADVVGFLPGRADYDRWLERLRAGH